MLPAVVVGAGPAGLATSRELSRRGVEHRVLERGAQAGHVWQSLYDSLTLHTGKHLSALPGMRFPPGTPLFPPRAAFVDYLQSYAEHWRVPLETGTGVRTLTPSDGGWRVETTRGGLEARAVVMATGIVSNPWIPEMPGRDAFGGDVHHSVAYHRPGPYLGRRVLVVGAGNSAGEIATELAEAGATVTVAVRSGANVVPRALAGVPIQYLAAALLLLPRRARGPVARLVTGLSERRRGPSPLPRPPGGPLDSIPLIGFGLVEGVRSGRIALRPGVESLVPGGARFTDGREEPFDVVLLATGYRPALGPLAEQVRTDRRGFALRHDRVTSADRPRLWLVGHNYDTRGGIMNIRQDAPLAAAGVKAEGVGV